MTTTPRNDDLRAAWFGSVSPNWPLARAKNAFRVVSKKVGERSSEYTLLSLTLKGIIPRDVESGKGKFPENFDTYQEVKKSDIIFACLMSMKRHARSDFLISTAWLQAHIPLFGVQIARTLVTSPFFICPLTSGKGFVLFTRAFEKSSAPKLFLMRLFPSPTSLPNARLLIFWTVRPQELTC